MKFVKLEGTGNDFVLIDQRRGDQSILDRRSDDQEIVLTEMLARNCLDRRRGVGGDQLLWLEDTASSSDSDLVVQMRNADGSVAEMCGNGIRAVVTYLELRGEKPRGHNLSVPVWRLQTLDGVKTVEVLSVAQEPRVVVSRVNMGVPPIEQIQKLVFTLKEWSGEVVAIPIGVPHAVTFTDHVWGHDRLEQIGPQVETHPAFPNRTNFDVVQVVSSHRIAMWVWERGAGITLACGTGATASAIVAILQGRVRSPVDVVMPGGTVQVEWAGPGQPAMLSGPARWVFEGEIDV